MSIALNIPQNCFLFTTYIRINQYKNKKIRRLPNRNQIICENKILIESKTCNFCNCMMNMIIHANIWTLHLSKQNVLKKKLWRNYTALFN